MSHENFIVENGLNGDGVDVVVGIPSYNEADSIPFVVEQVARGLERFFPELRTAIINADNFSQDGTREAFFQAYSGKARQVYLSTPEGVQGKGNNFLNLFNYLSDYRPRAVVVVDADLRSIQPEWIRCMVRPILAGFHFVTPLYSRNEYDGTITNHLCYPLLYGLLGKNVRQPIGGDFAFSTPLMEHWRRQPWTLSIRRYGVDIFMSAEALLSGFPVAQVALGSKVHKPSAPKLGPMFTQVVDTLFSKVLESREAWSLNGEPPEKPRTYTCPGSRPGDSQPLSIDYKTLKRQALEEFRRHRKQITRSLEPEMASRVCAMFDRQVLRLSASTWARCVYSYLAAYSRAENRQAALTVVEALKPLYFGRVVSFIRETLDLDHSASEEKILQQAEIFRRHRSCATRAAGS